MAEKKQYNCPRNCPKPLALAGLACWPQSKVGSILWCSVYSFLHQLGTDHRQHITFHPRSGTKSFTLNVSHCQILKHTSEHPIPLHSNVWLGVILLDYCPSPQIEPAQQGRPCRFSKISLYQFCACGVLNSVITCKNDSDTLHLANWLG